jgi:hypothetical protein
LSSTNIRFIQDVIMEKGGGVDKFNETAKQEKIFFNISIYPGAKNEEERANAFAPAVEDMSGDGID